MPFCQSTRYPRWGTTAGAADRSCSAVISAVRRFKSKTRPAIAEHSRAAEATNASFDPSAKLVLPPQLNVREFASATRAMAVSTVITSAATDKAISAKQSTVARHSSRAAATITAVPRTTTSAIAKAPDALSAWPAVPPRISYLAQGRSSTAVSRAAAHPISAAIRTRRIDGVALGCALDEGDITRRICAATSVDDRPCDGTLVR